MKTTFIITVLLAATTGCGNNGSHFDASGTFEADEVIVSAELTGKILALNIDEGDTVSMNRVVGSIDAKNLSLQKEQVEASIAALGQKTANVAPQVRLLEEQLRVNESQMESLQRERTRIENLLKHDAATGKQLDDINAQIDVLRKQMNVTKQQINVQRSNIGTQNRSILSEGAPLEKRVAQLNEQLEKSNIVNPVNGTVLSKYAEAGEVTAAGKALYKIADLSFVTLRAYITGEQLPAIRLGQPVTVFVDQGKDDYSKYPGTITWIADKAEFTPKTIQTREERANLVYAIKVRVKNDGYLKIGMYAELQLNNSNEIGRSK